MERTFPSKSKGSLTVTLKHGEADAFVTAVPAPRTFKTGSEGYFAGGKMVGTDGHAYQVSLSVIRIGSDSEPEAVERQKIAELVSKDKAAARAKRPVRK